MLAEGISRWESVEYHSFNADLILCYKIVFGLSEMLLSEVFHLAPPRRQRAQQLQLAKRQRNTNSCLRSFQFRVIRVWNLLHADIVNAHQTHYRSCHVLNVYSPK